MNKNKFKSLLLSLSSSTAVVATVATAISCGVKTTDKKPATTTAPAESTAQLATEGKVTSTKAEVKLTLAANVTADVEYTLKLKNGDANKEAKATITNGKNEGVFTFEGTNVLTEGEWLFVSLKKTDNSEEKNAKLLSFKLIVPGATATKVTPVVETVATIVEGNTKTITSTKVVVTLVADVAKETTYKLVLTKEGVEKEAQATTSSGKTLTFDFTGDKALTAGDWTGKSIQDTSAPTNSTHEAKAKAFTVTVTAA